MDIYVYIYVVLSCLCFPQALVPGLPSKSRSKSVVRMWQEKRQKYAKFKAKLKEQKQKKDESLNISKSASPKSWGNPLFFSSTIKNANAIEMTSPGKDEGQKVDVAEDTKTIQELAKGPSPVPGKRTTKKRYQEFGYLAVAPGKAASRLEAISLKKHDDMGETIKKFWLGWFEWFKKPWTVEKTLVILIGIPSVLSLPFLLVPFLGVAVTIAVVVLALLFAVQMLVPSITAFFCLFVPLCFVYSIIAASQRSIWIAISTINGLSTSDYVDPEYSNYAKVSENISTRSRSACLVFKTSL